MAIQLDVRDEGLAYSEQDDDRVRPWVVCDARRAGIWRRGQRMLVSAESGLLASDGICADLVAVDLGALRRVE